VRQLSIKEEHSFLEIKV